MKIAVLLFFSLIISLPMYANNHRAKELDEVGIGLVVASNPYAVPDSVYTSLMYTDRNLKTKYRGKQAMPSFFYKPDYGLYHFICLEKTSNYYKVIINKNEIAFIRIDSNFYFKSWESMLMQYNVTRISRNDNPILDDWHGKGKEVKSDCENELLHIIDVFEGNGSFWIMVTFTNECDLTVARMPNDPYKYGWIKWRDKHKLLVGLFLLC